MLARPDAPEGKTRSLPGEGMVSPTQLLASDQLVLVPASSPLHVLVDSTTRTSRISSPITPRGRRLGSPRPPRTRPNPHRPWLRSRIDMAKTPFRGPSSHQERRPRSVAPTGSNPLRPASNGFDAPRKTALHRLENIYHQNFTCLYKVSRASVHSSTNGAIRPHAERKRTANRHNPFCLADWVR